MRRVEGSRDECLCPENAFKVGFFHGFARFSHEFPTLAEGTLLLRGLIRLWDEAGQWGIISYAVITTRTHGCIVHCSWVPCSSVGLRGRCGKRLMTFSLLLQTERQTTGLIVGIEGTTRVPFIGRINVSRLFS